MSRWQRDPTVRGTYSRKPDVPDGVDGLLIASSVSRKIFGGANTPVIMSNVCSGVYVGNGDAPVSRAGNLWKPCPASLPSERRIRFACSASTSVMTFLLGLNTGLVVTQTAVSPDTVHPEPAREPQYVHT